MSRWNGRPARRRAVAASSRTEREEQGTARVLVEDHDGLLLLRTPTDDTLHPADIADLARVLRAEEGGTVTIVAVAEGDAAAALWPRLSESLDSLRDTGTRSVRLVIPGAGHDRPDRPALARRIAESWNLTVEAPDGPVLVVPGGSVFVPPGDGGWWRFAPGQEPEVLGPRAPAPDWQAAVRRVPVRTADGCVVDQIPAGLLIRPAEASAPRPGDLFHAIPVDPRRPAVVVGVPWGEDVVAADVAELLGALPAAVRPGVRLAPGGRRDLLPLGQSVAGLLNAEVEVTTGLPLFAADSPLGTYGVRSVLAGPDGDPRWLPFVDAVMCLPPRLPEPDAAGTPGPVSGPDGSSAPVPAPAPRLLRWSSPVPDPGGADDGVLRLSDEWQATVTRAGLWVGPRDGTPLPRSLSPVSIEGPVVEVGRTGDRLDASLWPVLSRLLDRLAPDLRARTTLHVHATPPDGGRALRALAAEHALRVIRFAPPARTPRALPRGATAVRAGGAVGGPATVALPHPMAMSSTAGDTAAAVSVLPPGTATAPPAARPDPSLPRRAPVTAGGAAEPAPAAPGRPATVSGRDPAGGPGPSRPTLSPGEPPAEPTTGLVSEPVSAPEASRPEPVSGSTAGPVSPVAAASGLMVSGPTSAPQASRPEPTSGQVPKATAEPVSPVAAAEATASGLAVSGPASGPTSGPTSGPASAPQASRPEPTSGQVPKATAEPVSPVAAAEATASGLTVSESASAPTSAPQASRPEPTSGPVPKATAEPVSPVAAAEATASGLTVSESASAPTSAPQASRPEPTSAPVPEPTAGPVREAASGPVSAPEAPRPEPVATGVSAAPVAPAVPVPVTPARPVPTSGGAAPRPSSPVGEETPRKRDDGPVVPDHSPDPAPDPVSVHSPAPAPAARPPAKVPGGSGGGRPLPVVPVSPRHRSTASERDSFRTLAEPLWERHSAAVNRVLAGMPALRGEEQEAARIDLIALRMYLRGGEAPLNHEELTSSLRAGAKHLVPYAGCLASGLGRLPSYRGVVLRGRGGADGHGELRPGAVLRDPAPLSGLPLNPADKTRIAGAGFAIWSITGRRVRQLLDSGDEVVFPPGTTFRVLGVRTDGAAPLVLLRQLPESHAASDVLEGADETALARLDHALTNRMSPGTGDWPDRCAGPVGEH
ncbi:hypothetical protein [Streptomyces sp. GQFP]|uniref:hypothetical protein n=1 Tax=Streptomyces sp. GQFP TaxID=2907545 RepID=UPI001F3C5DB5|nr:hypothetical protein [Streptomyces sp. GQFP]UIX32008.1 hypothetical protein LUX31_19280 [Streptomyces sp. GQFP]